MTELERYGWSGEAEAASAFGTSTRSDRLREDALEWLRANPAGTVRIGIARLSIRTEDLEQVWKLDAAWECARWIGGVPVWERVAPAAGTAAL